MSVPFGPNSFPHPCARCAKSLTSELQPNAPEMYAFMLDPDNPPTGERLNSRMLCTRCGSLLSPTWFPNLKMEFTK